MSDQAVQLGTGTGFGATERRDAWWVGPLLTVLGLGGFTVYTTFRIFYNADYLVDTANSAHILSPFYSPLLVVPDWFPAWFSPAMFILWAPGGFRLTCYYYRKAYYRSFFFDPPACAVGEPRHGYQGETRFFLFQNLHRFMLYLALIILCILSYDVLLAMWWPTADGGHAIGMSVATIVLGVNVVLLAAYTLGCHSLRHLVGGKLDCFDCENFIGNARYKGWRGVSFLNKRHMLFAWLSLFSVGLADLYVWLVASGAITDYRFF